MPPFHQDASFFSTDAEVVLKLIVQSGKFKFKIMGPAGIESATNRLTVLRFINPPPL